MVLCRDKEMSRRLAQHWVNFASTGDPTLHVKYNFLSIYLFIWLLYTFLSRCIYVLYISIYFYLAFNLSVHPSIIYLSTKVQGQIEILEILEMYSRYVVYIHIYKVVYTSVIIRDFWTVTFEHTDLRFSAHCSLR